MDWSFHTASGMDCMQCSKSRDWKFPKRFQYRKRYGLHAICPETLFLSRSFRFNTASGMDCMQLKRCEDTKFLTKSFNTASGMDCMQLKNHYLPEEKFNVSIPQAVWIACNEDIVVADVLRNGSFNTASGMDCMQS